MRNCEKVFLSTKLANNAPWSLLPQTLKTKLTTSALAARHDLWYVYLSIIFVTTFWTGAPRFLLEIT